VLVVGEIQRGWVIEVYVVDRRFALYVIHWMDFIQAVLVLVQFYSGLWLAIIYRYCVFIGPLFLAARYLLNIYSVYVLTFC